MEAARKEEGVKMCSRFKKMDTDKGKAPLGEKKRNHIRSRSEKITHSYALKMEHFDDKIYNISQLAWQRSLN